MEAAVFEPIAQPRRAGGYPVEYVAVGAVAVIAWLPVLAAVLTRTAIGWGLAFGLAVVVERVTARLAPRVLLASLVVAGAFVPSGLVTDSTHYLPVAVVGGAIALRFALEAWRNRSLARPAAEPLVAAVGIYLLWAALATLTSIDHRLSAAYWLGMVAVCALAFWALPTLVSTRQDREFLLAVMGALGVVVAATVYVLSIAGDVYIFGRRVSDHLPVDLTIAGHATGVHFGRSAGLFIVPLEPSVIMVMALVALLGWTAMRHGPWMWAGRASIVFVVPAVLIALDRSAWLAAIVATGVFAALPLARRSATVTAAVLCLVFTACFVDVIANGIGVNAVESHACTTNCQAVAPGTDEVTLRGGTGLSGREYLWHASLDAIKKRPLLGYGPGNNVPAIEPYLSGEAARLFRGLTSHSTWLRTAVEDGIPGLLIFLGVLLVAAVVFMRAPREPRRRKDRRTGIPDPTRVTLAVSVVGLLGVMSFESFFLGGVNFSNLYLALALALMLPPMTLAQFRHLRRPRLRVH
ncbi:MAG TPA: O-antigen ligase family protein [Candidatus Dormibacteraeota bacterium]|nr:O-antigen ligase family protein [Candidatus Dormibacteraeota bacterium]